MRRWLASVIVLSSVAAAGIANAQETAPGPGTVEVSVIPGGATFVRSKNSAPDFRSYDAGGALAYNFSRILGVEGEAAGSFGFKQSLDQFGGISDDVRPPNQLSYTGNVVVMAPGHSVVPYATGGVGGLTLYKRELLGIFDTDTFLTGNVGGGVKWYAPGGRWGLRGDYRFQAVKSKDNAPEFFGMDNRYSHRVYGAVVINAVK
jgi:hypothetical protein